MYRETFAEADGLFRQGNYSEALMLLLQLDQRFPDTRNILFPMALCHAKMGKTAEAVRLCHRLVEEFEDVRAAQLLAQLNAPAGSQRPKPAPEEESLPQGTALTALKETRRASPPPLPAQNRSNWKPALIGVALVALLAFLLLPLITGYESAGNSTSTESIEGGAPSAGSPLLNNAASPSTSPDTEEAPLPPLVYYGARFLTGLVANIFMLYLALSIMGKHPHEDFGSNLRDTVAVSLILALVGLIPFVGFILAIGIVMKFYDLGILEVVLLGILMMVISFAISAMVMLVLAGGIATQLPT